jgi:lysophospholipase L1-like esterase
VLPRFGKFLIGCVLAGRAMAALSQEQALAQPRFPLVVQNSYASARDLAKLGLLRNTYQQAYVAPADLTGLNVAFLNAVSNRGNNAPGENPQYGNPIGIRAAVVVNGVPKILRFSGSPVLHLNNQASWQSDFVALQIPKGSVYYVRTEVSVENRFMSWPANNYYFDDPQTGATNSESVTLLNSNVDFSPGHARLGFGPSAIFGRIAPGSSAILQLDHGVVMVGDSILAGWKTYGYRGAVAAKVPLINFGRGGESALDFADPLAGAGRREFLKAAPTLFYEYGVNDINAHDASLSMMQTNFENVVRQFRAGGGKRVVVVSLTPIADKATDSIYAPRQFNPATRYLWNNWLSQLDSNSFDVDLVRVDIASTVEDLRSGTDVWRYDGVAAFTDDGVHPNVHGIDHILTLKQAEITRALTEPFAELSSFSSSTSSVNGGSTIVAKVTFTYPLQRAGSVHLATDQPGTVHVPSSVLAHAGQGGLSFSITTSAVGQTTTANVLASFRGRQISIPITVLGPVPTSRKPVPR